MRLTMLRSSCQNGRTCPNLNTSDRSTLVVQGYTADTGPGRDGAVTVTIPRSLVPQLQESHLDFALVGADVRVTGPRVTDTEALAELALPPGEDAVEVPLAQVPQEVFA